MKNISAICNKRFASQQEYLGNKKIVNNLYPLVSITVTTYQHAPYILDCLNGILMQKTTFPFEIIIGEDESNDGTREICIDFAAKHPGKVRLFLRDRDLSRLLDENDDLITTFNGIWTRKSSRGKYIAWCDGDDYWTDPSKLQTQVDFLENNEEYVLCYHDSDKVNKNNKLISHSRLDNKYSDFSKDYILAGPFIPTNTVLFRNIIVDYPDFFFKAFTKDTVFFHLLGFHGGGKFVAGINNSVYRQHDGSMWSSLSNVEKIKKLIVSRTLIRNNLKKCYGFSHKSVKEQNKRIRVLRKKYLYQFIKKIPFVSRITRSLRFHLTTHY